MSVISQSELCLDVAKLFPPKGQWSEFEYLALDTNRLVELSDGSIEVLEMPTDHHQAIVGFLYDALKDFVRPRNLGTIRFAPLPVKLWPGKFREPDVLFMLAEHDERRTRQFWIGADLVMEVISEDRDHDLVKKRGEYARAGILEYWIVDQMLKEISVLRLAGSEYEQAGVYRSGDNAESVLLPGFSVDVAQAFDAK
jgi:Uma2 family endonuclease